MASNVFRRIPIGRIKSGDLIQKIIGGYSQLVANEFFEAVSGGGSPFTFIGSTFFDGDVNGGTTSSIDTTGAKIIIISAHYYYAALPTISDSNSNVWVPLTEYRDSIPDNATRLYYCINPTVGAGHNFSTSGAGSYSGIRVLAFSSSSTPFFDSENGSNANALTIQPGIINPANANNLFVAAGSFYANPSPMSIDSGFTIDSYVGNSANSYGAVIAYKISAASSSENPIFTGTGATFFSSSAIANFYVTGGGGGGPTIGPLKANDFIVQYASAILRGKGILKANDYVFDRSTSALKGKGALKGSDNQLNTQIGVIIGRAKATANDYLFNTASAVVKGKGALKGNDRLINVATAILKGKGALKANDIIITYGTGKLFGGLTLKANDYNTTYATGVIKGKGALKGRDFTIVSENVRLKGKGKLVTNIAIEIKATAALKGKGGLRALDELVTAAVGSLKGKGAIKATDSIIVTVYGELGFQAIYGGKLKKWNGTEWVLYRLTSYYGQNIAGKPMYYHNGTEWKLIEQA